MCVFLSAHFNPFGCACAFVLGLLPTLRPIQCVFVCCTFSVSKNKKNMFHVYVAHSVLKRKMSCCDETKYLGEREREREIEEEREREREERDTSSIVQHNYDFGFILRRSRCWDRARRNNRRLEQAAHMKWRLGLLHSHSRYFCKFCRKCLTERTRGRWW